MALKRMLLLLPAALCAAFLLPAVVVAQVPAAATQRPSFLILGSFHFEGSTADLLSNSMPDVLTEKRQKEIEAVVAALVSPVQADQGRGGGSSRQLEGPGALPGVSRRQAAARAERDRADRVQSRPPAGPHADLAGRPQARHGLRGPDRGRQEVRPDALLRTRAWRPARRTSGRQSAVSTTRASPRLCAS